MMQLRSGLSPEPDLLDFRYMRSPGTYRGNAAITVATARRAKPPFGRAV